MLQVLVSIQGLILNAKPYFNEPGHAYTSGMPHGEKNSLQYNESTFILSLKTMVYSMRKPPKVIIKNPSCTGKSTAHDWFAAVIVICKLGRHEKRNI